MITNKRHKNSWQKSLEDIMYKYVDLCVELKMGKYAKVRSPLAGPAKPSGSFMFLVSLKSASGG